MRLLNSILALTLTVALKAEFYPFESSTRLVFSGDSMSTGYALSNTNLNWPFYLTNYYATDYVVKGGYNTCVPGYTTAQMAADYATKVRPLKPNLGTNAILFVWCGVNDFNQSIAYIHDNLSNYWVTAKADGFKVVACTICAASSITPAQNAKMESVNALIRQSKVWDYLLDGRQIVPSPFGTTTDGVHFTTNYHAVIARAAFKVISSPEGWDSDAPLMPAGNIGYLDFNGTYQSYVDFEFPVGNRNYCESLVPLSGAIPLASSVPVNVTSIPLTAGDWLVSGSINYTCSGLNGGATDTASTISAAGASFLLDGSEILTTTSILGSRTLSVTIPPRQFHLTTTTTVYLVADIVPSSGSAKAWGFIGARKMH